MLVLMGKPYTSRILPRPPSVRSLSLPEKVVPLSSLPNDWLTANIKRAGAVPYTVVEGGDIMFCMGVDNLSGDYTDFGGGFSLKKDMFVQKCVVRELEEESLGVFKFPVSHILNNLCVYNDGVLITFIYIPPTDIETSVIHFERELSSHLERGQPVEVRGISWMSSLLLKSKLESGLVFDKVTAVLKPHLKEIRKMLRYNTLDATPRI